jgi:hypothetical protein
MKYLLLALLFTACNWGLVDIKEHPETCYDLTINIGKDTTWVDSIPKECGYTEVTTPFDHFMDPVIK